MTHCHGERRWQDVTPHFGVARGGTIPGLGGDYNKGTGWSQLPEIQLAFAVLVAGSKFSTVCQRTIQILCRRPIFGSWCQASIQERSQSIYAWELRSEPLDVPKHSFSRV